MTNDERDSKRNTLMLGIAAAVLVTCVAASSSCNSGSRTGNVASSGQTDDAAEANSSGSGDGGGEATGTTGDSGGMTAGTNGGSRNSSGTVDSGGAGSGGSSGSGDSGAAGSSQSGGVGAPCSSNDDCSQGYRCTGGGGCRKPCATHEDCDEGDVCWGWTSACSIGGNKLGSCVAKLGGEDCIRGCGCLAAGNWQCAGPPLNGECGDVGQCWVCVVPQ